MKIGDKEINKGDSVLVSGVSGWPDDSRAMVVAVYEHALVVEIGKDYCDVGWDNVEKINE